MVHQWCTHSGHRLRIQSQHADTPWGRRCSSAEAIYSAIFDAIDFDQSGELAKHEFVKVRAAEGE